MPIQDAPFITFEDAINAYYGAADVEEGTKLLRISITNLLLQLIEQRGLSSSGMKRTQLWIATPQRRASTQFKMVYDGKIYADNGRVLGTVSVKGEDITDYHNRDGKSLYFVDQLAAVDWRYRTLLNWTNLYPNDSNLKSALQQAKIDLEMILTPPIQLKSKKVTSDSIRPSVYFSPSNNATIDWSTMPTIPYSEITSTTGITILNTLNEIDL